MSTTEHAVEAVGLVKRRGGFTLGPLDLRVPRGFVTGMVGANGSGKTTTLRTLLGLIRADAGSIAMPPMGEVGVAFDQPFVLPYWRVRDAAEVYATSRPGWDQNWFDRLCRRFGLRADERVKELSRGQGNKLMIALAMGNHPDLLILDEPTSGLDPAARADLVDLLREHMRREEASLLFSTHITSDLEHFADYLVFVDNGQVVYSGPLDELVESFAYVKGALEDLTAENTPLIRGLRRGQANFDGIIPTADSAAFGPGVHLETPTIEQIVVHYERRNDEEH
ncbi:ATP-binding cassette domain-containing protein [Virgisporangium aurantiacum]|uniref:ABC transporter ATP-binding protein n=1 Tax=Virgisporangium aurantiacum TaxID=175570 RepID=A0A8J3ZJC7_9ACTN|nr:ABC transporter ATP-binding protein [Virgisporangium aurantiacum]GIJ63858.1 ABC transporter ATP-binding protein [Virgisporangium aurantiacum]